MVTNQRKAFICNLNKQQQMIKSVSEYLFDCVACSYFNRFRRSKFICNFAVKMIPFLTILFALAGAVQVKRFCVRMDNTVQQVAIVIPDLDVQSLSHTFSMSQAVSYLFLVNL